MFDEITWRGLLIAACALLTLYSVFVLVRINRLKNEEQPFPFFESALSAAVAETASPRSAFPSPEPSQKSAAPAESPLRLSSSPLYDEKREPELRDTLMETFPPKPDNRKKMFALEQELDQLRKEVGGLRAEILLLREAYRKSDKPAPAQPISSFYNDAMQMASQGEPIDNISKTCGISRAEAELVMTLVKNRGDGDIDSKAL